LRSKATADSRLLIAALGVIERIPVQRLSEWLQVLTNVGVVIGLLLVAYQIEQTNESLELQKSQWQTEFRADRYEILTATTGMIAADKELTTLWRKGLHQHDLNEDEAFRFRMIADQYMWGVWNVFMNNLDWEGDNLAGPLYAVVKLRRQYPGFKKISDEWNAELGSTPFTETLAEIEERPTEK
jgi:hypothetical protein